MSHRPALPALWRPARIIAWRPDPAYAVPPDLPTIDGPDALRLWLNGYDTGVATVLRTLADVPASMLPETIDHLRRLAVAPRPSTAAGESTPRNHPGKS